MYFYKGKIRIITIIVILIIYIFNFVSNPISINSIGVDKETPKVLVILSAENGEVEQHQRMLDILLSRFTSNIVIKSASQVIEEDFQEITHLFYYGQQKEILSKDFLELVQKYKGIMVAIGYNVEQFKTRFSFMEVINNEVKINKITLVDNFEKQISFSPLNILNMYLVDKKNSRLILVGQNADNKYPLFVEQNDNYYFAAPIITFQLSIALSEMLFEIFEQESQFKNLCYIRLEDIHPLVDIDKLIKIADILKEKNIPYMIAVIPVYTNPESAKQYHLSDSPELIKTLKYMQKNGGSIILHGYTHQFRLTETGEGFEFWDVKYNMPIYHMQDENVVKKTRKDFDSNEEYDKYISDKKAFERNYIETKLRKGIQELANYGLYPLAFEAPHYAISQHGYQIVSEYFSTYVGNVQLSDESWEVTASAPYMTKPSFLHGMTLLPETIGYVDPENPNSIEEMINNAKNYQFIRNGVIGGFYHPYLSVDLFTELIGKMENIPNIEWIDLKKIDNQVSTENVDINTKNGEVIVEINHIGLFFTSISYLQYHVRLILNKILWVLVNIGLLSLIGFICGIFISITRKKREIKIE